jgi:hypothetical protein
MTDQSDARIDAIEDESAVAPWLLALLPPASGSPFATACLEAVEAGVAISKLRHASQRLGPSLLGVLDYLRALAGAARANLEPVLRWAGLPLNQAPEAAFASAWGRLAIALGLGLEEARWHLRLTFLKADELDYAIAAGMSPGSADSLATLSTSLVQQVAGRWDDATRAQLRECERFLTSAYQQADQAEPLP